MSKQKKSVSGKYGLTNIHKRYFRSEGFDIYAYARSQGYSVKGAKFLLALSAQETGYGTEDDLKNSEAKNNFWGIKIPGSDDKQEFDTKEAGEKAGIDLISRKYKTLAAYLKKDNGSLSQMDAAFKGYNTSANGKEYATWLSENVLNGASSRTEDAIDKEIADYQSQIDNIVKSEYPGFLYLAEHEPEHLSQQQKIDLQAINNLKEKIEKLSHIKQEFETGQADDKYFAAPKASGTSESNPATWPEGIPEPPYFNPDENQNELYPDVYSNGYTNMFNPDNLFNNNLSQPANDNLLNPGKYSGDHPKVFLPKNLLSPPAKQHKHKKVNQGNKPAGGGTSAGNNYSMPGSGSSSSGYASGSSGNNLFAKSNPDNSFGIKPAELNNPVNPICSNDNLTSSSGPFGAGPEESFTPESMFGGGNISAEGLGDHTSGGMTLPASGNLFTNAKSNSNGDNMQPGISSPADHEPGDIGHDNEQPAGSSGSGSFNQSKRASKDNDAPMDVAGADNLISSGRESAGNNNSSGSGNSHFTPMQGESGDNNSSHGNNDASLQDMPSSGASNLFSNNSLSGYGGGSTGMMSERPETLGASDLNKDMQNSAADFSSGNIFRGGNHLSSGYAGSGFNGGMHGGNSLNQASGSSNLYNNPSSAGGGGNIRLDLSVSGEGAGNCTGGANGFKQNSLVDTPYKTSGGNLFNQSHPSHEQGSSETAHHVNSVNPDHMRHAHASGGRSSAKNGGVTFHVQTMSHHANTHKHAVKSANDIHKHVVAVLTAAVGDSKIGIDVH